MCFAENIGFRFWWRHQWDKDRSSGEQYKTQTFDPIIQVHEWNGKFDRMLKKSELEAAFWSEGQINIMLDKQRHFIQRFPHYVDNNLEISEPGIGDFY